VPQFKGSITDTQADAILHSLLMWLKPEGRSTIAAIVCDAVHEDITLQPLHDAYERIVRRPLGNL
jgi:hypothetical protein